MVRGEEAAVLASMIPAVPETGEVAGEAAITAEEGKGTITEEEAAVFPAMALQTLFPE